ncbi:MAG TPA: L-histidine N(alpha)-methyltransferase [Candidatus Limnocylindria bacterium]|nr:L-histidine N(alpha)-methyltransferase [Candidatus Limnocylindria bacterium]
MFESLRSRAINHKFHYDTYKQAAKWLALHEAYSPARRDPSCLRIYDDAFQAAIELSKSTTVHVIGLGCGGGQKEARLLELLREQTGKLSCTVSDVSLPLVLSARTAVLKSVNEDQCSAVVCDLGTLDELAQALDGSDQRSRRIVTLFGIVPNFEPGTLLPRLHALLRADDLLLISANLVQGGDYARGVERILPQYDNPLTRDWLLTLLLDLGFNRDDGELKFTIETDRFQFRRIAAHFELRCSRELSVLGGHFLFQAGEQIRVFFSYRHTSQTIRSLLSQYQIEVLGEWLNDSREESVFLCRRTVAT